MGKKPNLDMNQNYISPEKNGKVQNIEKIPKSKSKIPKEKEFIPRNSLLTDLIQTDMHINVIYRIFLVALSLLYVRFILTEYSNGKKLTFGTKYIVKGFNHFENLVVHWFFMFFLTLVIFPSFYLWSMGVEKYVAQKNILSFWNKIWLGALFFYIFSMVYVPLKFGALTEAMVTNTIILCEQIRFLMKTHAFLRHNCPRIFSYKPHTEKEMDRTKFSQFLYYYFAPTFIYRDEYPRTAKTNWGRTLTLCVEFVGCIFWASFLIDSLIERYKNFGLVKETYSSLLLSVMDAMLVSPFFLLTGFYILLHVWLNIWAELLRFADRKFYSDWWNSESFSMYYRKWNQVVHEYLHTYLYKDIIHLGGKKSIATLGTFLVSILIHEYIVSLIIGFFLPIMGIQFFLTVLIVRIENYKFFNSVLIWGICIGTAMELCFYAMEYFARQNCPIVDTSLWKNFQFRLLTCNGIDL